MSRRMMDLLFRLRALLFPGRMERELDDEVSFHLEMETAKQVRAGLSQAEARRRAVRNFGGVGRQKEAARDSWGLSLLNDLGSDLKRGGRQLRRAPGFAAAAITTLALGIGATTAIFSIAWRVLGEGPPVRDPGSLVAIYTTCRRGDPQCSSSWPDYLDYRDRSRTLAEVGAFSPVPFNLGAEQGARLVTGQVVTGNLFSLLGVRAQLGRLIGPEDDRRGAAAPVVVVSHDLWRGLLGGDSSAIGRPVRINDVPFTVIGVAGPGFRGLSLASPADAWIPVFSAYRLRTSVGAVGEAAIFDERGARWLGTIVGRRGPGVTLAQVQQEMDALARALGEAYPDDRSAIGGVRGITVDPAEGYILPLGTEGELRRFLTLLLAVVGAILLLAAVNVANLLLARASARGRELGVQLAMGAKRGRVVRQLLTESLLLGVLGGAAGLAVALLVLRGLGAYELPGGVSIGALEAGIDARVLLFALATSLLTAVGFGLLPALRSTRTDLVSFIKGASSRVSDRQRLRRGLVALQVALCVVLLIGSGLFLRTLRNSLNEPLGFEPSGAVAARFNLTMLRYGSARTEAFTKALTGRVRGLPGVRAAAVGTLVPFQRGGFRGLFAEVPGYSPAPDEEIRFDWVVVTPEYFEALGTPLLAGRSIGPEDGPGGRPVAVVNRFAAEKYWPGTSPVGRVIRLIDTTAMTVIGVVENPTWRAVGEQPTPFVFISMAQYPEGAASGFLTLVARADGPPAALLPAVREAVRSVEPGLSLALLEPLDNLVGAALMPQRVGGLLLTLFGGLALLLAAVGIYGVVGYTVARQAREIGIRMAVGAGSGHILLGVTRGIAAPVLAGLLAGMATALLLRRSVAGFLYGVTPGDPLTLLAMAGVLSLIAVLATIIPARRALRLDPVAVLSEG